MALVLCPQKVHLVSTKGAPSVQKRCTWCPEKLQKSCKMFFYNWNSGPPRDATFLDTGLAKKSRLYLPPGFRIWTHGVWCKSYGTSSASCPYRITQISIADLEQRANQGNVDLFGLTKPPVSRASVAVASAMAIAGRRMLPLAKRFLFSWSAANVTHAVNRVSSIACSLGESAFSAVRHPSASDKLSMCVL